MIGIHASVNWNGGKMDVRVRVQGRCEHPLEHLYSECLRQGLRSSLEVAHAKELEMDAKAAATNIKIDLPEPAASEGTPAPLSEDAVEIKFPPQAAPARPPMFSEFILGLKAVLSHELELQKGEATPNQDIITCYAACSELLQDHAEAYMQKLLEYHKARAAVGGQQS